MHMYMYMCICIYISHIHVHMHIHMYKNMCTYYLHRLVLKAGLTDWYVSDAFWSCSRIDLKLRPGLLCYRFEGPRQKDVKLNHTTNKWIRIKNLNRDESIINLLCCFGGKIMKLIKILTCIESRQIHLSMYWKLKNMIYVYDHVCMYMYTYIIICMHA